MYVPLPPPPFGDMLRSIVRNLKHRPHNVLRLTRILKHFSEIPPLQAHAAPLVLFFTAQHSEGEIDMGSDTMHGESLDRWWCNCFRDAGERGEGGEGGVWDVV